MSVFPQRVPDNAPVQIPSLSLADGTWFGFPVLGKYACLERLLLSGGTILEIENALRSLIHCIQRAALEAVAEGFKMRDRSLPRPACPLCGHTMWCNRKERLTLQFLEGEVHLLRNYLECRACRIHFYPLDADLGLAADGECTSRFGQDLCLLAIQLPCQASVDLLQALTGRSLAKTTLQQHVARDGDALVALERLEAERLWPYDEKRQRRPISADGLAPLRAPPKPGRCLVVEMDGVFGNIGREPSIREEIERYRAQKESLEKRGETIQQPAPSPYREIRQARFYRLEDRIEKRTAKGNKRVSLLHSETISVVNDPLFFEMRVNAVAHAWEADQYVLVVVMGDGGDFIWDVGKTILNPKVEVLDVQHAKSHIHTCAKALFGDGTPAAKGWARQWCQSVLDHGPTPLLEELHRLTDQSWSEAASTVLKNLVDYVTKHRHRMDYPKFRALGLPIASGAIESANRQVVGDRCKRSGMTWTKTGLQRILSLRAAYLSGSWDHAFAAIRSYRSYSAMEAKRHRNEVAARKEARSNVIPIDIRATAEAQEQTLVIEGGSKRASSSPARRLIPERKVARLLRAGVIQRSAGGGFEAAVGQ